jgi:DNA polymerase III subunit beta
MKITVLKSDILKGVGKVITAVNPRNTLPILSNILLETIDTDTIKIVGTDLEIGIISSVKADISEKGEITIPAKKFMDIIKESPEEEIDIQVTKNNSITIKSGKAFFKLMGLPKDDFPKFSEIDLSNAVEIEKAVLKECVDLVSFAISTDETRYVLNGALVIIKDKKIKMISTDGRRLAIVEKPLDIKPKADFEVIVPTKTLHEISKNIQEEEGTVTVVEIGNQIFFKIDETTIISRLIEGHFPNYEQVIPSEERIKATIDREKLLATIRRVSLLTSLESQAIKVDLLKNNKMILSSRSPNLGESKEEIELELQQGEDITMGFNPLYLIDVLKHLDIKSVELTLNSPEKPGVISGKEGYTYIIMPMQIG